MNPFLSELIRKVSSNYPSLNIILEKTNVIYKMLLPHKTSIANLSLELEISNNEPHLEQHAVINSKEFYNCGQVSY